MIIVPMFPVIIISSIPVIIISPIPAIIVPTGILSSLGWFRKFPWERKREGEALKKVVEGPPL